MFIILGKNGYIAEAIIKELKSQGLPHVAWSRSEVDYTDPVELEYRLITESAKTIHLINCAGFIGKPNVDACELAKADCIEGNVVFPAMASSLCFRLGIDFTHISSGCIYGGYEKHFTEQDPSNFDFQNGSFYSGTKALAEKLVQKNNRDAYIFRLRMPFDEFECSRNYITKLLKYDKLLNAENSLSHRADFAKYTIELIEQDVPKGIYNITNKGSATTKQVAELLQKHNKTKKNFEFFDNLDTFLSEVTAPRSNCVLDTSKIEQYIKIRTAEEALEEAVYKYSNY